MSYETLESIMSFEHSFLFCAKILFMYIVAKRIKILSSPTKENTIMIVTDVVLFAAFIFTSVFVVFEIGKVLEQDGLVMQKYYESIRLLDMILTTVLSITLINKSDKTKNEVKHS